MKILKEISTHKAIENKENSTIDIYEKGIDIKDLHYDDVLIDRIPIENKDDLLPIFDLFEETNRINVADFEMYG